MGFGPTGYNGKTFAEMNEAEKQAFASQSESLLEDLSHYKNEKQLKNALEKAITNGLLYHADGKPVAVNEIDDELTRIRNGYENNIGLTTFLSDFVLVRYDQNKPEKQEFSYHPITAQFSSTIEADTTPFTAEELAQKYEDNAEEIEIQKKIAAERRPVDFSELGPKEYDGVSFGDMSEEKEQEYKAGVAGVLGKLANRYDIDSAELQEVLVDATKYGMLIYPDGKEITRQEVEATLQKVRQEPDPNKKSDILGEFTVLEYDPTEGELGFLPLSFQETSVLVRSGSGNYLDEKRLKERKERYEGKVIRQREKAAKEAAKSAAAAQAPVEEVNVPTEEVKAPVVETQAPVENTAPTEEVKAPVVETQVPVENNVPAKEVKAPIEDNRKRESRMKFKPQIYDNQRIDSLSPPEKGSYQTNALDVLTSLYRPRQVNQERTTDLLEEACAYDMLFYPDGKRVTLDKLKEITTNKKAMPGLLSDLVVAYYDPRNNIIRYHAMNTSDTSISVNTHVLKDDEFFEKQQEYIEKKYNAEQADKIKAMDKDQRKAYFDDMDYVFDGLYKEGVKVGSEFLELRLKYAIERGIVRLADGNYIDKSKAESQAALIAKTPAYLKNLVFTRRDQAHYREQHETYRLVIKDGEVRMDYKQVTPLEIAKMEQDLASLDKRSAVPGLYAQALKPRDEAKIEKYIAEMKEYGFNIENNPAAQSFRVPSENEVYLYGNPTPIKTPDELMSAKGIEPPKEPNSWGFFEGIRKAWHSIFHNVADYNKYDDDLKQYEIDKYYAAKDVGFKVDDQKETVERYERELAEKREAAKPKEDPEVADAMDIVGYCAKVDETSAFYQNFKEALCEKNALSDLLKEIIPKLPWSNEKSPASRMFLRARKEYEVNKDAPYMKRYGKYAAVYLCSRQQAFDISNGDVSGGKLSYVKEVNKTVELICDYAAKLTKENEQTHALSEDRLQEKINDEAKRQIKVFNTLAKEAEKNGYGEFSDKLEEPKKSSPAVAAQNPGKVTDVAKAKAATDRINESIVKEQKLNANVEEKVSHVLDLDEVDISDNNKVLPSNTENEVGNDDEIEYVGSGLNV